MKKNNNSKKETRKLYATIALFCLATILLITGQFSSVDDPFQKERFTGGSVIEGVDVSGLTTNEANTLLVKKLSKDLSNMTVNLSYKDNAWEIDGESLSIQTAVQEAVEDVFSYVKAQGLSLSTKKDYKLSLKNLLGNVKNRIDEIVEEIESEPVNASVDFNPNAGNMFLINESKVGVRVDKEKLYQDLEDAIRRHKSVANIEITTYETEPEIKESYFADKLDLMGKFSTTLKNSQEGRRFNVTYALSKFNGLVVEPNETISFNQITGPQTLEGGYQPATIILNGVFTEGIGGGLCQASTTMYNACLLANMEIVEVHKHTLPVSYVELSLDAMVSDGYSDFMFKNSSENPIYIKSYVEGDNAIVELYGRSKDKDVEIKRVAEFVGNIPHNGDKIVPDVNKEYANKVTYKGEYYRLKYPREGYEAKGYLEYYKNGELYDKKEIRHEKYMPVDGIIIEGTEELPEGFVLPEQDVEIIAPQNA